MSAVPTEGTRAVATEVIEQNVHGRTPKERSVELFDTTQLALERAIQGAATRQTALANNIANANTPGYRRRDLDFHSALRAALQGGKGDLSSLTFAPQVDPTGQLRADGNGVDIDTEASYLAQTGLEYQGLVQVARGRIDIIDAAIGAR